MEALVKVENDQIVTDSRSVAEHFGKKYKDVLVAIKNLAAKNPATKSLFHKTTYISEQNGHSYPMYLMNRDGFSLLVMGFTGAKVLERKLEYIQAFKLEYIQAFNACVQHKTEDSQLYPKATEKGDRNTNDIKIFENPEFDKVRTIVIDDEPWFVGKDVINILKYQNGSRDIHRHVDEDDRKMVDGKTQYRFGIELGQRVIDDKNKQITEMKPKAEFYDTVANTESLFSMADVAKTLDMGMGRNKLFAFLRDKGILDKDNHPYQKYVDAGYLRLIENHCKAGDNDVVYKCTYVKQKGIDYIRKILLKERGLNENMG